MSEPEGTATVAENGKRVIVYSKESGCVACTNTKRWLLEREIPFTVENIHEPEHLAEAETFGIRAAPMVEVKAGDSDQRIIFSDFRPDVLGGEFPPAAFPKTRDLSPKEIGELAPTPALRMAEAA